MNHQITLKLFGTELQMIHFAVKLFREYKEVDEIAKTLLPLLEVIEVFEQCRNTKLDTDVYLNKVK